MSNRLKDKVCVITGSGGSMGREAALLFSAEGAKLVGCDVNPDSAEETLQQVTRAGGEMVSLQPLDLSDLSECQNLMSFAAKTYGGVDLLFNNGAMAWFDWFPSMTRTMWSDTLKNELDVVFCATQAAWPHFINRGGGAIVNVASIAGSIVFESLPGIAHTTAKAGVIGMTRHLAMEGASHNIRVNALSPGPTLTNQTRELAQDEAWMSSMNRKLMIKRLGKPIDIAYAALYLLSDEASWVTGADLKVDGGCTAW